MNYTPANWSPRPEPWNPATGELTDCPVDEARIIETVRRDGWQQRVAEYADAAFDDWFHPVQVKINSATLRREQWNDANDDLQKLRREKRMTDRRVRAPDPDYQSPPADIVRKVLAFMLLLISFGMLDAVTGQWLQSERVFEGIDPAHPARSYVLTGLILFGGAAVPLAFARTLMTDWSQNLLRRAATGLAVIFVPVFVGLLWKHHDVAAYLHYVQRAMPANMPDDMLDTLRLTITSLVGSMLPVTLIGEILALIALELNLERLLGSHRRFRVVPNPRGADIDREIDEQRTEVIALGEQAVAIETVKARLTVKRKLNRERWFDFAENYFRMQDASVHAFEQEQHRRALENAKRKNNPQLSLRLEP